MKILVIEDNAKHVADAINYCSQLKDCSVDCVTTLAEAMEHLKRNIYDGAICDVFFPAETGAPANTCENAITISKKLVELGIHHVFNTAGNHHGRKFQDFIWKTPTAVHTNDKYGFLATGMVIEAYPEDSNAQKDSKQWQAAFRYILLILALLQLPDKGMAIIKDAELSGFPYGEYGDLTEIFQKCTNAFVVETFQKFNA